MSIEEAIQSNQMDLNTKTVINILYTSRILEESGSEILKRFDVTSQQFNVLRILRGQKGKPANLSTVQERMIDKSSNTTRLVDKLIKKGYVKRSICKENRRKVEILITEDGLNLLLEIDPLIENNNTKMLNALSNNQLQTLNDLLDALRNF
ncbi:MarR family winged helix-turn-helix transcriptional regulator [Cochleicola gelatinilyticus]|uniref:MarR family transcriptional regulator n=1 Tax=Cochleicola gelatinilyticus TaxID=1763537 RepID=A0A167KBT5_9FLAO|nr:MarR family transcriptional regulator [Cochleicola gelatinilyticus]OAB81701.1 MarR family transcriptional regulator [Cochleicola gelatinilyticus]